MSKKSFAEKLAQRLRERDGFDKTVAEDDGARIGCSQCQALVINGIPCHETGCPNERKDSDEDES